MATPAERGLQDMTARLNEQLSASIRDSFGLTHTPYPISTRIKLPDNLTANDAISMLMIVLQTVVTNALPNIYRERNGFCVFNAEELFRVITLLQQTCTALCYLLNPDQSNWDDERVNRASVRCNEILNSVIKVFSLAISKESVVERIGPDEAPETNNEPI